MSRQNCSLYVDANGRYCCVDKVFKVGKGQNAGITITLANTGPVVLLVYPTGDTDEPAIPHSTLSEGTTTIFDAGVFQLDLDCDKLDGADAGDDPAAWMLACCEPVHESVSAAAALCAKLEAIFGGDGGLMVEVDFTALQTKICELLGNGEITAFDKLCEIALALGPDSVLCKKLAELVANNSTWCEADNVWQTLALACFNQIKANTSAITGIETSMGQMGCTRGADGEVDGAVLVCKVSPEDGGQPTIVVWRFGTDGSVTENYDGPWEGCTSLQALADLLDAILKCPKPVNLQCLKKPTRCIGYDNGRTPGSSSNDGGLAPGFVNKAWEMRVKSWTINGVEQAAGETLGPFGAGGAGWTEQLQAWADFFNSKLGDNAKCEAAFGFLPAPTWRYTKITCHDTTTQFGPLILERVSDGVCFTIWPILESYSEELAQRYHTVDCDGVKKTVWCDEKGATIPAPEDADCYVDCATEVLPMVAVQTPDCTLPKITKLCDVLGETEIEFYRIEYFCDGEKIVQDFTAESYEAGNPEDYEVSGKVVNCITKEPVTDPVTLDDFKVVKASDFAGADFTAALCYINGRPNSNVPWEWIDNTDPDNQVVIASGNTLEEFIADAEGKGYTEFSVGEQHYICPVPASFTEPGSHFFNADGNTASKPDKTSLAKIEGAPQKVLEAAVRCALQTIGCNDDRRDQLLADIVTGITSLNECMQEFKSCDDGCPKLLVSAAEFATDSANGTTGQAVMFPLTSPVRETSDIAVAVGLPADMPCEIPPETPMVLRWCFDHSIDASSSHTGFNVSANDGTQTIGTVVGQSNAPSSVHVGPGSTPHNGPRDKYWVDIEVTAAQLQAGLSLLTSAFGTITEETETIHSQDVTLQTDLSQFGCC